MPDDQTPPGAAVRARHSDPRNTDAADLSAYDFVEIEYDRRCFRVSVRDNRLIVSGIDALILYPIASNWIEIQL